MPLEVRSHLRYCTCSGGLISSGKILTGTRPHWDEGPTQLSWFEGGHINSIFRCLLCFLPSISKCFSGHNSMSRIFVGIKNRRVCSSCQLVPRAPISLLLSSQAGKIQYLSITISGTRKFNKVLKNNPSWYYIIRYTVYDSWNSCLLAEHTYSIRNLLKYAMTAFVRLGPKLFSKVGS